MKGRFLALWTAAVLATAAAFVVHLTVRLENVRLGYEIGEKRKQRDRLLEERRMLSVESAALRQGVRVETVARGMLRMEVPRAEAIIVMDRRNARRAAGSAQ